MRTFRWLLGQNVRTASVLVDIHGIAFTPEAADQICRTLVARNEALARENKTLRQKLYVAAQEIRCYEETSWRRVKVD